MCEVCRIEGQDYLFKNGPRKILTNNNLYKVFSKSVAPVKLCHVHSVELFRLGERRFLEEHSDFSNTLALKSKASSKLSVDDSPFGF